MTKQFYGIRVTNTIKQFTLCQQYRIFKIGAVYLIYIHSYPMFRLMVKGEIIHKMNAS